ncbi:MAG: glucose/sorbosone dehydrogenase [Cyanobacteria bacterium J06638_28]
MRPRPSLLLSHVLPALLLGLLPLSACRADELNAQQPEASSLPMPVAQDPLTLVPNAIALADGTTFNLSLPPEFQITVAAEGLKRIRFMAQSPDNRIFVTDMFNLTDNTRGKVYILEDFDAEQGTFGHITTYLSGLRNPNSVAFYTDSEGNHWLYLALTDKLVRYPYRNGDIAPSGEPQVLAEFPDYGLSYKYGGWHLTRTVLIAPNDKVYVSIGSSCNVCEETEAVRATIMEMNPDGSEQRFFARGLRNSVGIDWAYGTLFAVDMGSDHLGNDRPDETLYAVTKGQHYGWPYCFQAEDQVYADPQFLDSPQRLDCETVPLADVAFPAHSAPLGIEFFGEEHTASNLQNYFLVALHGSSDRDLGRGYQVARAAPGHAPDPFIDGFLQDGEVYGRPADIFTLGPDTFLLTDDHRGVVYYVTKRQTAIEQITLPGG